MKRPICAHGCTKQPRRLQIAGWPEKLPIKIHGSGFELFSLQSQRVWDFVFLVAEAWTANFFFPKCVHNCCDRPLNALKSDANMLPFRTLVGRDPIGAVHDQPPFRILVLNDIFFFAVEKHLNAIVSSCWNMTLLASVKPLTAALLWKRWLDPLQNKPPVKIRALLECQQVRTWILY